MLDGCTEHISISVQLSDAHVLALAPCFCGCY